MARRTIHIPGSVEKRVLELAEEDESFSATVTRLIEAGARALEGRRKPSYVGVAEGEGDELGRRAEEYLREAYRKK
jgi:predicted CopG family antitoxin